MQVWNRQFKTKGRVYLQTYEKLPRFINLLNKTQAKRVLDLGSSTGRNLVKLAEEGFDICGIDFSQEAIRLAEKWVKDSELQNKVEMKTEDFYEGISYKDDYFDGVLVIDAIQYTDDIEKIKKTIDEIARVLKNKGLLLLTLPSKEVTTSVANQRTFTEKEVKELLGQRFRTIEFGKDSQEFYYAIATRIS